MSEKNSNIVLCINPHCDGDFSVTLDAKRTLEQAGYKTTITLVKTKEDECDIPQGIRVVPLEEAVKSATLLISFGGDGTIIKIARAVMTSPVPLLGVNLGHKGFMAELEPGDKEYMLRAAAGDFTPIKRTMLDVELIRNGECVFKDSALNDAIVSCTARAMNIEAYGDGAMITAYSGDGVIVATPTGSTAYSMSAGGPLVEPTAESIILTPICAHLMNARPFVLAPDRCVTIKAPHNDKKKIWLSVDGCEPIPITPEDEIRIKKSIYCTIMAKVTDKSFYDIAFKKLGG